MRFRIVNEINNEQKSSKEDQKDPETRQSSGNKHTKQNSFLQMVKNSYQFYMTVGKDLLIQQQQKVAIQKEQKLKKLIKKQLISEERQQNKFKQLKKNNPIHIPTNNPNKPNKNKPKPTLEPSRRSKRTRNLVSYHEANLPINDKQIFDVLNIEHQQSGAQKSKQENFIQLSSSEKVYEKKRTIIEKIEQIKDELIFQEQGTYEIGVAHQSILRIQKFIDEHINFRHEIRELKFIQLSALIKYIKSHGFVTFDERKFNLLIKINPYLYNLSESDQRYLMTFKLNGLQIQKRLQSTRRRMTQVSVAELFT